MAATIDHGLRPEAAGEAALVARLCRRLAIPHDTVRVSLAPGNLQDRARQARYAALCAAFGARGAHAFATAHHAEDQAETILMRLSRGSGLAGLAGIRARRVIERDDPPGEYLVVRPLLGWRRSELAAVVAAAGVEAAHDPSNDDPRFDRVQARRALAALPWLDPVAVARSAGLLQEAEDAVADAVAGVIAEAVRREGDVTWLHWGHARLLETEAVAAILEGFGAMAPRSAVAQMVDQLRAEGHATLAGVMARRARHRLDSVTEVEAWRFEREPPRRSG